MTMSGGNNGDAHLSPFDLENRLCTDLRGEVTAHDQLLNVAAEMHVRNPGLPEFETLSVALIPLDRKAPICAHRDTPNERADTFVTVMQRTLADGTRVTYVHNNFKTKKKTKKGGRKKKSQKSPAISHKVGEGSAFLASSIESVD